MRCTKRVWAIALCLSLIAVLFAGCSTLGGSKLSGIELAKLLLANERLDAEVLLSGNGVMNVNLS